MAVLLPYTFQMLSRTTAPAGTGAQILSVQIVDRAGSIRATVDVHISLLASFEDIQAAIRERVSATMATDAGSGAGLIDQFITDAETFDAVALRGVRKSANESTTSTTFVNCADLAFLLAPTSHYKFSFTGGYTAAIGTTGLQLSVTGPTTPAFLSFVAQIHTSQTATFGGAGGAYDVAIAATASGGATPLPFFMEGTISTGAAGGTLQLRMRTEVIASAVTILRGSVGELIQVA